MKPRSILWLLAGAGTLLVWLPVVATLGPSRLGAVAEAEDAFGHLAPATSGRFAPRPSR